MLGAQVAMPIDDAAAANALGEQPSRRCAETGAGTRRSLRTSPAGKTEARIEQDAAIVREAPLPIASCAAGDTKPALACR